MNKAALAAVALLLAAGLGYWFLAEDTGSSQAPLVPDAPSPAATAAPAAPNSPSPDPGSATSGAANPKGAPGASSPTGSGGATAPNPIGGKPGEPTTSFDMPGVFNVARGLDRPEAKAGEAVTAAAMKQADMGALDPSDGAYDEVVETHQLFNALEKDFLSRSKVTAEDWVEILNTYAPAKEAMLERTVRLSADGHVEESESMLLEWGALEGGYAAKVEE